MPRDVVRPTSFWSQPPSASESGADVDRSVVLGRVFVPARSFDRYRPFLRPDDESAIRERAARLHDARIVEVSEVAQGGSVPTLLQGLMMALGGLGLDARWYTLLPDETYFGTVEQLTYLVEGAAGQVFEPDLRRWAAIGERIAENLDRLEPDVLVLHDLVALGAVTRLRRRPPRVIWRCHLDLTAPNPAALELLRPQLEKVDLILLEAEAYRMATLPTVRQLVVPDAVDPLALKNQIIGRETARTSLARVGIDPGRPLVSQIARVDPLKNPLGALEAFQRARTDIPGLQLALVGAAPTQEMPWAAETLAELRQRIGGDPAVLLLTDPASLRQLDVNAFQTGSDAVLLLARREGFGLAAAEAMWKKNVVIAGSTPGLREQITDGRNGYIVDATDCCAERIVQTVRNRDLAETLGQAAHETVAERFLLPRLVLDLLSAYYPGRVRRTARAA
jgi:trehalose synthase